MERENGFGHDGGKPAPYLSPLNAWALAFGCAVGWGAFVMPGNAFLPMAGPLGSLFGFVLGAAFMLVIGVNYRYMMARFPDAGGSSTYAREVFGHDHGFLCAWFSLLTYVAIAWANATAIVLVARNLLGPVFQFGFHYTLAGYDVFFGEALVTMGALLLFGAVCCLSRRLAAVVQTVMALLLAAGILVCFGAAALKHGGKVTLTPYFVPGEAPFMQVFGIAALAPWAFVGFESIAHSAGEFRFSPKKSLRIMMAAVIAAALA